MLRLFSLLGYTYEEYNGGCARYMYIFMGFGRLPPRYIVRSEYWTSTSRHTYCLYGGGLCIWLARLSGELHTLGGGARS